MQVLGVGFLNIKYVGKASCELRKGTAFNYFFKVGWNITTFLRVFRDLN